MPSSTKQSLELQFYGRQAMLMLVCMCNATPVACRCVETDRHTLNQTTEQNGSTDNAVDLYSELSGIDISPAMDLRGSSQSLQINFTFRVGYFTLLSIPRPSRRDVA
jgi:hypothetical protein